MVNFFCFFLSFSASGGFSPNGCAPSGVSYTIVYYRRTYLTCCRCYYLTCCRCYCLLAFALCCSLLLLVLRNLSYLFSTKQYLGVWNQHSIFIIHMYSHRIQYLGHQKIGPLKKRASQRDTNPMRQN